MLHYRSDKHECGFVGCATNHTGAGYTKILPSNEPNLLPISTTVTVMGWTRTGLDAQSALVNVPLPGLVLNVPGVGTVTTDNNGEFTIDIAAVTNITVGTLDGRHHNPLVGANAPSGVFPITPGVNSTIQLLTAAATTNEGAHTTTSYWVDVTNELVVVPEPCVPTQYTSNRRYADSTRPYVANTDATSVPPNSATAAHSSAVSSTTVSVVSRNIHCSDSRGS